MAPGRTIENACVTAIRSVACANGQRGSGHGVRSIQPDRATDTGAGQAAVDVGGATQWCGVDEEVGAVLRRTAVGVHVLDADAERAKGEARGAAIKAEADAYEAFPESARLQMVLTHDRSDISPVLIEQIKDDIIKVIAQHLAIDPDQVVVNLTGTARESRLVAEIPLQESARQSKR